MAINHNNAYSQYQYLFVHILNPSEERIGFTIWYAFFYFFLSVSSNRNLTPNFQVQLCFRKLLDLVGAFGRLSFGFRCSFQNNWDKPGKFMSIIFIILVIHYFRFYHFVATRLKMIVEIWQFHRILVLGNFLKIF